MRTSSLVSDTSNSEPHTFWSIACFNAAIEFCGTLVFFHAPRCATIFGCANAVSMVKVRNRAKVIFFIIGVFGLFFYVNYIRNFSFVFVVKLLIVRRIVYYSLKRLP